MGNIDDEYNGILANAGAVLPQRDSIDARIITEVENGTGEIIDSQDDVGGYPEITPIILSDAELDAIDAGRDGMADSWETAQGLNPESSADAVLDIDSDGYTNREKYLNSLSSF